MMKEIKIYKLTKIYKHIFIYENIQELLDQIEAYNIDIQDANNVPITCL